MSRQAVYEDYGNIGTSLGDTIGTTVHTMTATASTGLRENTSAADQAKTLVGVDIHIWGDAAVVAYGTDPVATGGSEVGRRYPVGSTVEVNDAGKANGLRIVGESASTRVSVDFYYDENR